MRNAIVVVMFLVCMVSIEMFKLTDTMPSKDVVVADQCVNGRLS